MRHDPAKAWPHPVLHPHGDDYPNAEFTVDIDLTATERGTKVKVDVVYRLSEPDLLRLIDEGVAAYCLLVKAPGSQYRRAMVGRDAELSETFGRGALAGRVTLTSYVVCVRNLTDYRADGWHPDFGTQIYTFPAGTVLAEEVPKEYWIDTADDRSLGSIVGHKSANDVDDGYWEVQIDDKRIWIVMSYRDSEKYRKLRNRIGEALDGQYLMNGLYLPALVEALNRIDDNVEEYQDYRWFAWLDRRLGDVDGRELGAKNTDRVVDAQKILEAPMLRMPFFGPDYY